MRRRLVLFFLAAAAAVVPASPAAHAHPVCARALSNEWTLPEVDTGQTCVSYPYGVYCRSTNYWDGEFGFDVWVWICLPGIV